MKFDSMIEKELANNISASWLMNCPACSAVNSNLADFCQKCNYKFEANLNPLGIIHSEGEMLRRAVKQKPKFIVLLGTWVIFFPVILSSIALIISLILNQSGTTGFLFFWLGIFVGGFSLKLLYTVTKNYFTMKDKVFESDGEMLHQEK